MKLLRFGGHGGSENEGQFSKVEILPHSGPLSSLDFLRNILEMRLLHQNQSLSRKEESRCRPKSNAGRLALEKATP
jgi:hypothetical protein